MFDLKILALLAGCLFGIASTEMCTDTATMFEVPKGILAEIITTATTGLIDSFVGCHDDQLQVNPEKINFWLWNKENPDIPLRLDHHNPSALNPTTKIIFIIHGWTCNITGLGYTEMKNAYLKKYPDANIIGVEWATYSVDLYVNSYCYVPKVAEIVSQFICNLKSKFGVDAALLHIVGHSLGGQMAGLIGQVLKQQCKTTLGRITALDPAGPLYQTVPKDRRLDGSDAALVDVIHCTQATFGYYGSCGTVDYFPNCGFLQPGCLEITLSLDISVILNLPFKTIFCGHERCIDYFNESILSDNFKAKSCATCPGVPPLGLCIPDLFGASSSIMGEDHDKFPSTAPRYFLGTKDRSPFAQS